MATKKTKTSACSLDHDAEIQKALKAIEDAQNSLGAGFALSARATSYLLEAQAALSEAASCLRGLCEGTKPEAQGNQRSPSQARASRKPAVRRQVLGGTVPTASRPLPKRSAVGKSRRMGTKLAQYKGLRVCTCIDGCRGAEGLGEGWICALKDIEKTLPY